MKAVTFDELAALPLLQRDVGAFRKATRAYLKLLPPEDLPNDEAPIPNFFT